MKTQMTITMEDYLKDGLRETAKNMGTNTSNLISMLVANLINTGEVVFSTNKIKTSIEGLDGSDEFVGSKLHKRGVNILKNL